MTWRTIASTRFWYVLALVAVSATAFILLHLVIADLTRLLAPGTPADQARQDATLLAIHGGALLTVIVAVLVVFLVRSAFGALHGTLHYVSVLQAGMHDWYDNLSRYRSVLQGALSLQVIVRHVGASQNPQNHAALCTEVSRDLNITMNLNNHANGTHVAPAMLGPIAFGVGYQTTLSPTTGLVELGTPLTAAHTNSTTKLRWNPHKQPTTAKTLRLRTSIQDRHGTCFSRDADLTNLTAPLTDPNPSQVGTTTDNLRPGQGTVRNILITTQLIDPRLCADNPLHLVMPGADLRLDVRGSTWSHGEMVGINGATFSTKPSTMHIHPWQAAHELAHIIALTRHQYPTATVFLAARMPKTVSFALGWVLADPNRFGHPLKGHTAGRTTYCTEGACYDQLSQLIVLHYQGTWQPVRIHPEQQSVATQTRRFGAVMADTVHRTIELPRDRSAVHPTPAIVLPPEETAF